MHWPFQHFTTSGLLRAGSSPLPFPLRDDNTSSILFFFIVMKRQELGFSAISFPSCSRSFYRQKSWQSLYLEAIAGNERCFSVWLNTNKSDPLYFPLEHRTVEGRQLVRSGLSSLVDFSDAILQHWSNMQWKGLIEADTIIRVILRTFILP